MQEQSSLVDRFRARFHLRVICLFLAILMLGYYTYAGLCLGNAQQHVSDRMQFHAIPVAMSHLYYGKKHDLTAYRSIALEFQSKHAPLPELIKKYSSGDGIEEIRKQADYYWVADDRGMGDFTILAFRLFGPELSSLYWFYILLLVATCGAYVLTLYRDQLSMTVLVVLMSGYVVALFAATLNGSNSQFGENLVPIHDSRTLDAFALIGLTQFLLMALRKLPMTRAAVIGLGLQTVILSFLLLARSSLKLGLLALVVLVLASIVRAAVSREKASRDVWLVLRSTPFLVFVFLLAIPVMATLYKQAVYAKAYDKTARTVWHNVLMGVGVPEPGQPFPRSRANDLTAAQAIVIRHNAANPDKPWEAQTILNSLGGHVDFDWRAYEEEARDLLASLWREYPGTMLKWYTYDKPLLAVETLMRAAGADLKLASARYSRICPQTCEVQLTLLHWPVIAFLLALAVLARRAILDCWWQVSVFFVIGAVVYLIPAVLFYEFILNMLGTIVLSAALAYWIIVGLVAKFADLLERTNRRDHAARLTSHTPEAS